MSEVVHNPPGLSGEALASIWGTLRESDAPHESYGHDWRHGEIGGIALSMRDLGQDILSRMKNMTPEQRMAEKIRINSGHYPPLVSKASPRTIEITKQDDAWLIRFRASEVGMRLWDNEKPKYHTHWNGKSWHQITDVEVHGDYEQFRSDATLMMLFASQWMIDEPNREDPWKMIKGMMNSIYGATGVGKTMILTQQFGRGNRYIDQNVPVIFDYEASYDRKFVQKYFGTDSILLGIDPAKEKATEDRVLKMVKSRKPVDELKVLKSRYVPNIIVDDI